MTQRGTCYLTGLEGDIDSDPPKNNTYFWDPTCGIYGINGFTRLRLDANEDEKRQVAWALARRKARGQKQAVLIVNKPSAKDTDDQWTVTSVDELVAETPKSAVEMIEEALLNFTSRIKHPSETVRISPEDCWLAYAFDASSLEYVTGQLSDMGFLKKKGADPQTSYKTQLYSVEARGWGKVTSLQRPLGSIARRQAFVAMWFSSETEEYYRAGIAPAITETGVTPVRIDLKEHNNKICDEIVLEIRRSRFLVADFTGNRGGVYYEAGLAHGLGMPVIWTVHSEHLKSVHFDTSVVSRN